MRLIDLDPKDYRAQPLKGEPVFARGGLLRLAVVAGFFAFMAGVTMIWAPIAHEIIASVRAAVGR